ncbi:unnamed protein product [Caenorhabditis brenneri]
MDPTQGFPFFFSGFDLNNVGLTSDEAQQPGIQRADPLPDFSQLFSQLQGAPNYGSFALNSPGNTSTSDGTASDSEQELPPSASVPDIFAFFAQIQGSLPAFPNPQSTGIAQNYQEYRPDFHQFNENGNQLPNFASNPALFPNLSALLQNSPAPFTTQPVQLDFNTMLQGLFQPQTQNVVEHIAAADFSFAGPNPIAQSTQGGPSNRDSHSNNITFTDTLPKMIQDNFALNSAPSPHNARSVLNRSAPTLLPQSPTSSTPRTVSTISQLSSSNKRPRCQNILQDQNQEAPSNEATVSSVGLKRNLYSKTAEELSNDLLAVKPAKKIGLSAISNYLGSTKRNERNMSLPKILTAPTGSITHQLQGLPEWTQEIAADYGAIFEKYGKLQLEVEYSLELVTPPVLTAEEQAKKRAEAVEHENNCALYKDPQQSILSSLFSQHKPGFPQGVCNTATAWLLFKTFHTNSGVKNDQGLLDKMLDKIREEKGSEFWGWMKRASDLKDEQLRQRELGVPFTMDHTLLTKDDEQDPEIQEASDSSQDSPFDTSGLSSNPARLAINLADFSRFCPAPLALTSPANTFTSDGSTTSFGGRGLMSPDATFEFSYQTQDTLPSDATVPDLSVMISQILNSQSSLTNGHQTLPATQSVGIHKDDQEEFMNYNTGHATNNPMLDATAPDLFPLLAQFQGSENSLNNGQSSLLTPQAIDIHQDDPADLLKFHPTEPNNNPMLNSASNDALFSDPTLLSTLVQNMLNANSPTTSTPLAAQLDFNTVLAGLWGPLTQKIHNNTAIPKSRKKRSAPTTYSHSSSLSSSPLFPPFAKKIRPHLEDEEDVKDVPARYEPISPLLKGLEVWTPETAAGYKRTLKRYQGRRTTLTGHVKTFIPPVLNSEEKKRKHAEAVEYVRNCALYKDPKQSKLESLFDINKPDIPQVVEEHTVGANSIFDKYQHNKGIEQAEYRTMWRELKKEDGEEYWSWFKKASDLRDEHIKQSELGYIFFRECAKRPRKAKLVGVQNKKDDKKNTVAVEESVKDEMSDSIIDIVD